jgi:hypothetical protein
MSDLYNAAQQALEALVMTQREAQIGEADYAIAALRATLAQQAEPVREWQGLTEDEFWLLPEARGWYPEEHYKLTRLARAIEAALKEKNHG